MGINIESFIAEGVEYLRQYFTMRQLVVWLLVQGWNEENALVLVAPEIQVVVKQSNLQCWSGLVAFLAQLVEHVICNLKVVGSSPTEGSKKYNNSN